MARQLFALLRTTVFGTIFGSIWLWFIPRWIAAGRGISLEPRWSVAGVAVVIAGLAFVLPAMFSFAWTGAGTPAPFDPPRRLVVRGPYRWVRNPMYTGMALLIAGEGLMLPAITSAMLVEAAGFVVLAALFVMLYEEPALRRRFGGDYEAYCKEVRRWIPRLLPFDKGNPAAVRSPDLE